MFQERNKLGSLTVAAIGRMLAMNFFSEMMFAIGDRKFTRMLRVCAKDADV